MREPKEKRKFPKLGKVKISHLQFSSFPLEDFSFVSSMQKKKIYRRRKKLNHKISLIFLIRISLFVTSFQPQTFVAKLSVYHFGVLIMAHFMVTDRQTWGFTYPHADNSKTRDKKKKNIFQMKPI